MATHRGRAVPKSPSKTIDETTATLVAIPWDRGRDARGPRTAIQRILDPGSADHLDGLFFLGGFFSGARGGGIDFPVRR